MLQCLLCLPKSWTYPRSANRAVSNVDAVIPAALRSKAGRLPLVPLVVELSELVDSVAALAVWFTSEGDEPSVMSQEMRNVRRTGM